MLFESLDHVTTILSSNRRKLLNKPADVLYKLKQSKILGLCVPFLSVMAFVVKSVLPTQFQQSHIIAKGHKDSP